MELRKIIGLGVVLVFLLFVTVTYVSYSNRAELMRERGVIQIHLEGNVRLVLGHVYATIDKFTAQYDKTPHIPSFNEYLGSYFAKSNDKPVQVNDNETFVELHITITIEGKDTSKRTLLDKTVKIPYVWAGGNIDDNGVLTTYSYDVSPQIAYYEYSPYKVESKVFIDDDEKAKEVKWVTIEEPDLVPS